MSNFFKNQDYPFIFFILYILKSVALPGGFVDAAILLILGAFILIKYIFDQTKQAKTVILEKIVKNENEFRAKVNADMAIVAGKIHDLELKTKGNFKGFGV